MGTLSFVLISNWFAKLELGLGRREGKICKIFSLDSTVWIEGVRERKSVGGWREEWGGGEGGGE